MSEFVYVIGTPRRNYWKIGRTASDPAKRLTLLSVGSHVDLRIHATIRCERSAPLESTLHRALSHRRVRGEWFRATTAEVDDALREHGGDGVEWTPRPKRPRVRVAVAAPRWYGNQVLALRRALRLSQWDMAIAAGVKSVTTVIRWEHGKAHPSRMASDVLTQLEKRLKREQPDVSFVRPDPPKPATPPKKRAKK